MPERQLGNVGMSKLALKFVDIIEAEVFLSRFFSEEYDGRMYIKPDQLEVVKSVEVVSVVFYCWHFISCFCFAFE